VSRHCRTTVEQTPVPIPVGRNSRPHRDIHWSHAELLGNDHQAIRLCLPHEWRARFVEHDGRVEREQGPFKHGDSSVSFRACDRLNDCCEFYTILQLWELQWYKMELLHNFLLNTVILFQTLREKIKIKIKEKTDCYTDRNPS
jgi:hypothetical protein